MAFRPNPALWSLALLCLCACPESTLQQDAGTPGAAPLDAGTAAPTPAELAVTVRAELVDGGVVTLELDGPERPLVDPAQRLLLETNLPVRNYRVRVFDEVDRAMVSDDTATDLPEGLDYRISFPEPLKTGHRYTLVLDAANGATMVDTRGGSHADVRLPFQVSGVKEKPPPPPKKSKKRRR